ncbi:MAG: hypothetical protein ACFE7R_01945 [Candidatus Hodarchaeota archaeon]
MIDDDSYDYYGEPEDQRTHPSRWVVFFLALILGSVTVFGAILTAPPDVYIYYIIFLIPMVILLLYCTLRWAQGRPVVVTDSTQDDRIFQSMRAHALPVKDVDGMGMYRCPDCEMSFEISNATPVEENVVLCPICKTRLFIG